MVYVANIVVFRGNLCGIWGKHIVSFGIYSGIQGCFWQIQLYLGKYGGYLGKYSVFFGQIQGYFG